MTDCYHIAHPLLLAVLYATACMFLGYILCAWINKIRL